ncbi:DUF5365 family protein [Peribacillus sp. NPDC097264]|uniref:DUF5365 family protein n=1 Tax=unclassified Peribacillus TaxID=2675266 RepID=UPI003812818D
MKVVSPSTEEQEQEIADLVERFYESVFPSYFTKDEILHFKEIGVLQPNKGRFTYNGTLREAYQVMTCLQVLLTILDKEEKVNTKAIERKSDELFKRNITLLNECGIFFPFDSNHFNRMSEHVGMEGLPMYNVQVANSYLV